MTLSAKKFDPCGALSRLKSPNMNIQIRSLSLLAAGVLATAAFSSAQAVELQQKWQAGQALNYDLSLDGTTNIKVPRGMNLPRDFRFLAGVPLEIDLTGQGVARLNALAVSPSGESTVFVEVPKFDLNGSAFGQKALIGLRDGRVSFSIFDQTTDLVKPDPKNPFPKYALIIGKDGRVKGVKELDKNGKLLATTAATPTAPVLSVADDTEQTPVAAGEAIDRGAFISSMIMQALPTLWPQRDVQTGETWKTTLPLPAVLARNANAAQNAAPLSEWTMTLKGQEVVDGVSLWRVGIVGGLQVDGESLAAPTAPKKGDKPVPALENLSQRVNGDLWFDAAKGQVVRGNMVIDARGKSHTIDEQGRKGEPAWADFTGTFGMRLRDGAGK